MLSTSGYKGSHAKIELGSAWKPRGYSLSVSILTEFDTLAARWVLGGSQYSGPCLVLSSDRISSSPQLVRQAAEEASGERYTEGRVSGAVPEAPLSVDGAVSFMRP